MTVVCPNCLKDKLLTQTRTKPSKFGFYFRRSDGQFVRRFRCQDCRKTFSLASFSSCFGQNKRHKNDPLRKLLASGVSQRRAAKILNLSRTTVVRKFIFLGTQARMIFEENLGVKPIGQEIIFDDLETFEHTKCKPLSVTLAVEPSRRIVGFRVSQMPAKGNLAALSRRKYGLRPDLRRPQRRILLNELRYFALSKIKTIKSDENPHYLNDVRDFFPESEHISYKGKRGAITGQGELKKIGFDPLFCLNHTCAMFRANINRLFRRTWNTTKIPERLTLHIFIYANFHNEEIQRRAGLKKSS
jgi:transposase-like protein